MRDLGSGSSPVAPRDGILVLSGFGLRVAVERGHLVVSDGIGEERRSGRLSRATAGLKRLVVLGHSGTISLEALRWLHDIGAAFVQLDGDGQVMVASCPRGLDDARLRRAQALAPTNGVGIMIARDLLRAKLQGQAAVLTRLSESEGAIAVIEQARAELEYTDTPARLRSVEAQAATAYWAAWGSVPMRFARKDLARVPAHWPIFGTRASPITSTSRSAGNPINALLNYAYAILETEVRLAILAMGLDPGMGVLHADLKSRDSFVYDLLEPLRPVVDGYILTLLEERSFSAKEFFQTRQGVCRLMPPLPQRLAELAPNLAKLALPVVEQVAQRLAHGQGSTAKPLKVPTLLTQANRSSGRDRVRTVPKREPKAEKLAVPSACRECGVILEEQRRQYCDDCYPAYQQAQVASFSATGRTKLAELRAAGKDPSKGGDVAKRRAAKLVQRMLDQAAWEAEHDSEADPETFRREVLPCLQGVTLRAMAKVTGLSEQYCSLIRRGIRVPHPRHWEALISIYRG